MLRQFFRRKIDVLFREIYCETLWRWSQETPLHWIDLVFDIYEFMNKFMRKSRRSAISCFRSMRIASHLVCYHNRLLVKGMRLNWASAGHVAIKICVRCLIVSVFFLLFQIHIRCHISVSLPLHAQQNYIVSFLLLIQFNSASFTLSVVISD